MKRALLSTGLVALLASAGSLYVTATYGAAGLQPPPVSVEALPEALRPRLRLEGTIPVARLSGTHYEIGLQHGTMFRAQIRFLQREYFEAMVIPMVGRARMEKWARQVEPFIPQGFRDEMRGIADGAGGRYEEVLCINTVIDLMQTLMCSTVVASGKATRDGEIYLGRNLDFPGRGLLQRTTVVLVFEPTGETPVAAVTWPGLVGLLSGLSREGVAGATMMIHHAGAASPGVPYMMMYRQALTQARKTSDVHDFIAASRRTCPNMFTVVDSTGAAEVNEYTTAACLARPAEGGCLCSTNHFRSGELREAGWEMGRKRYTILESFLARERGEIDMDAIQRALRETATPWFLNVQSMVILPARREIHLAAPGDLPAADGRFVPLSREILFGDAGTTPH